MNINFTIIFKLISLYPVIKNIFQNYINNEFSIKTKILIQ
jgi:hypothetical protein